MNTLSLEKALADSRLRANGSGYTCRITDGPGVYDFEDAFERTRHCDASKMIEFEEIRT